MTGYKNVDLIAELETSLKKLHQIDRRQEMRAFDQEMFVDNKQLSQLETNDWQVIYGRRGTGKTTLLKAFGDHIVSRQKSVYSIFIDLRDCIPSATGVTIERESDFELALGYFYEFIRRFAKDLLDEYSDTSELSTLQRLVRQIRGSHESLDTLVLEICEIAEYYPLRLAPTEVDTEKTGEQVEVSKRGGKANGSLELKTTSISAKTLIEGTRSFDSTNKLGDKINEKFVFEAARRYQPLKRKLEDLLASIDADRLFILIDEWADLNRIQDDFVQPIFAELLRKTFGGSEKISIKIASIKGATRLNIWDRQGGLGMELNADIFEACDLDQVYISDENSTAFFKELLFKRLCKANPNLRNYSIKNDKGIDTITPPANFFSYIFSNETALLDLIKGSGKIPRDFVSLFCSCASSLHYSIRPSWKRGQILKEITEYSIQNKHEIVSSGDEKGKFFYRIVESAINTGSRVFLVSRTLSAQARELVSDLYHSRLIHPVNPSTVPLSIRKNFDCYYIDYGYFLEAAEYIPQESLVQTCPLTTESSDDEIESFIVKVEDIVGATVTCKHENCGEIFRNTTQSFVMQKLCPVCFRPATG